jgi:membrane fusion protein (multidrug efflux system)
MQEEIAATEQQAEKQNGPSALLNKKKIVFLVILILLCLWIGVRWFIKHSTRIETDNAFVEARVVSISSKVSGTVKRVPVNDNQYVKQGELLVELDEKDYQVRVSNAEAGVGVAENETRGEFQKAEGARATVQLAKARYEQSLLDLKRGEALFNREVIPKEQLDRLKTARIVAGSQLKEAEEALKRALAEAGLANKVGNKAKIMQRKAQLDEANLQLSYTRIIAPRDGYITRKGIEEGSNIQAGQPLMALVPLQDAWVTANYKEGQLTHIKPGQKVEFTVDSYPGRIFTGRVDSIMAGTGAAFSLLPPENATGNYVKVVQRVPVKILIDGNSDPDRILRVGMSVIPSILVERSLPDILKGLNPFR